ncbi:hypothetical protein SUGI_0237370 [Cryptomeria japonica]|nr:hypothetical protein SUGI_0237370 [Cryptomeria japonica]
MAVHWFNLETFYSQVKRFLRKPGGVIAVWGYHYPTVTPALDAITEEFVRASREYRDPRFEYLMNRYTTLPFPFRPVLPGGAGGEGNPVVKEMLRDLSLEDYLGMFRSSSALVTTREKGTELLNENVIKGIKEAWGDEGHIYPCKYEVYMLIGTILE